MDAKHHIVAPQYSEVEVGAPRPNHPDFMDSSELKKLGFSGLRNNSITQDYEIWIDGEVVKRITLAERTLNPDIVKIRWEELFGLDHVEFRTGE